MVGGDLRKVAGYGWPGRSAKARPREGMRVQIPCLPLFAPVVKWRSFLASNEAFRVRLLVGVMESSRHAERDGYTLMVFVV